MAYRSFLACVSVLVQGAAGGICNMKDPINRDFNRYYGLSTKHDPFGDVSSAENRELPIPYYDLVGFNQMHAKSMAIVALRGAGKTQLRLEWVKRVRREWGDKIILVQILGNLGKFASYLDNFLNSRGNGEIDPWTLWTAEHFEQMVVIELVPAIAHAIKKIGAKSVAKVGVDTRKLVAYIMAAHIQDDMEAVEEAVNIVLPKQSLFDHALSKDYLAASREEKPLERELTRDREKIAVAPHAPDSLGLLLHMHSRGDITREQSREFSTHRTLRQVQVLTRFLRQLSYAAAIVVDSMDENERLMGNNEHLEKFVESSVKDMLVLTQDRGIFVLVFAPTVDGFDWHKATREIAKRKDKLFIHELRWDFFHLRNYVDTMFKHMQDHAAGWSSRCRALPSFETLIGGAQEVRKVLCKLQHPRNFIRFFAELKKRLMNVAVDQQQPMVATPADVEGALQAAKPNMLMEGKTLDGCKREEL